MCLELCLQPGAARLTILEGEIQVTQSPHRAKIWEISLPFLIHIDVFKLFFFPCTNASANISGHIPHTQQNYNFLCLIFPLCWGHQHKINTQCLACSPGSSRAHPNLKALGLSQQTEVARHSPIILKWLSQRCLVSTHCIPPCFRREKREIFQCSSHLH